jgi:two-component system KDP operon response regulator KdpE
MSDARILVVDDDPQIRRVMRMTLVSHGYMVSDARSGEEALEALRGEKYDLVLLDINMPGIGGLVTCGLIRASSEIPIIVLTVRTSEKDKVEALDAGADDYVTKPFSTPELLARIRAALRRAPLLAETVPEVLSLGEVEINFTARRVRSGKKEVHLTPKEADLLRYLATNSNSPIAHTKLLQTIWGPDYGGEVEYLRVFVNHLRKKIEPDPSKPRYLLTVPRVGYQLHISPIVAGGETPPLP